MHFFVGKDAAVLNELEAILIKPKQAAVQYLCYKLVARLEQEQHDIGSLMFFNRIVVIHIDGCKSLKIYLVIIKINFPYLIVTLHIHFVCE